MIRMNHVVAIARAELRLTRRLVRYWIFLVVAALFALLGFLQIGVVHGLISTYSATAASLSPRFMIGFLGLRFLLVFTVGVVFLGFDVRARDRRERMIEVLDSRPFSNLELLAGRFLGLLVAGWIPLIILTLFVDGVGALLQALHLPMANTIEPVSLVAFVIFMALPSFAFAIGLVFLITLLVRHRLIAAVLLVAVLGAFFWATLWLPLNFGPFFDLWGAYVVDYPSDMMPGIAEPIGWLQRLGVLLAGFGWLALAAAVHPRLDGGRRSHRAAAGGGLLVVAVLMMGAGWWERQDLIDTLEHWNEVHEARLDDAIPDISKIRASVALDPGNGLEATIDMSFSTPLEASKALFTFNPGLEIVELTDGGGAALQFEHGDGLLEIDVSRSASDSTQHHAHLEVRGRVNPVFGYLDEVKRPESLTAVEGAIYMLGFLRAIDDGDFVGLMPGVGWLPSAGCAVHIDDPARRPRDFFELELEVAVPEGWIAAGPGSRQILGTADGQARFRFSPGAPVPEAALLAGRYESMIMDVENVRCELLLHPGHLPNLAVLETASIELRGAVEELLGEAADGGFAYPYNGFTLVEVPNALRGFSGGWRLDTAMAPPAMVLVRESGLPSARFDVAFRKPEDFQDREGGLPRAMRDRLEVFFRNDFSGGNLYTGVSRSFFQHQTSAAGSAGLALNFALEELASLAVTGDRGYFSAHFFDKEMGRNLEAILTSMANVRRDPNISDTVIGVLTSRPAVWESVLEVSLDAIDPWVEPSRSVNALTLKAGAMSTYLFDALGQEDVTRLLAALRTEHVGHNFELTDVMTTAQQLELDIGPMIEAWMTTTTLPAFVGIEAEGYRLPDSEEGSPRYQLLATVRNDESSEGMFRFSYRIGTEDDQETVESDPIRLAGRSTVRWGVVMSRPPQRIVVQPYLALNRETFRIPMDPADDEKIVDVEPVEGRVELEFAPPNEPWIAVDDLDEGFEIVIDEERSGLRLLGRGRDTELDAGLPLARPFRIPGKWSRTISQTAWGRYRHTIAVVKPGKGKTRAVFTTEVPKSGGWDLEIHLCHKERFRAARSWGVWKLTVVNNGDRQEAEFDASAAPRGWNLVGGFELADGEVAVELSDESTGKVVIADAIRWIPVGGTDDRQVAVEEETE